METNTFTRLRFNIEHLLLHKKVPIRISISEGTNQPWGDELRCSLDIRIPGTEFPTLVETLLIGKKEEGNYLREYIRQLSSEISEEVLVGDYSGYKTKVDGDSIIIVPSQSPE